jgi:arylsulfatase A-like enzyme
MSRSRAARFVCAAVATALLACGETRVERERIGERLAELGRASVVLFVVDTLRADHLAPYGAPASSSPELADWAANGVTFEQAYAQSSWTKTSMASLFTSLWPRSHAVKKPDDGLGAGALTLGELLRDAGYRTYAVQTNGWLAQSFGFQQGFERYMFPSPTTEAQTTTVANVWPHADTLYENLLGILDELDPEQPFFVYLHFMDVHEYAAPPDVPRTGPGDLGAYGASVRWIDEVIARTRRELERRGLAERSILVLASDHGEEFGEHGVKGHARNVLSGVLHVPLLIRFPFQIEPVRIARQVRNLDLAPTLLELLRLPAPDSFEGTSLVPQLEGAAGEDLPWFASLPTRLYPDASPGDSVGDGRWTFVRNLEDGREQLFDRQADPAENVNLLELEPTEAQRMRALLAEHLARPPRETAVESGVRIDPEVAEKLRAVGYFQ